MLKTRRIMIATADLDVQREFGQEHEAGCDRACFDDRDSFLATAVAHREEVEGSENSDPQQSSENDARSYCVSSSALSICARIAPSGSCSASAPPKASASAMRSAIAKSTFLFFLHSSANIKSTHASEDAVPMAGEALTRSHGFIRRDRQYAHHGFDSSQNFLSVEMRMHRQRQRRVRERLAGRKITGSITEGKRARAEDAAAPDSGFRIRCRLEEARCEHCRAEGCRMTNRW